MTLIKYPTINKQFDSLFDDFFGSFPSRFEFENSKNLLPSTNISETENSYLLELNVPGRKKEDFNILIENGLLTISFEKKSETEQKDAKFIRREFNFNSFKRSFSLDEKINVEKIEANYMDGVLKITLPKIAEIKETPKQIVIK
jgi:HSP20 family protein